MVNSRRIGLFSNARGLQRGLVGGVADSARLAVVLGKRLS